MAALLSSIHLHTGPRPAAELRAWMAAVIRGEFALAGFASSLESERVDRMVVITADPEGRWVSLGDDGAGQGLAELARIAESLSRELATSAVVLLARDHTLVELLLLERGKTVDAYSNHPDHFGAVPPAELLRLKGHAAAWDKVVATPAGRAELALIFRERALPTSALLARLEPLLGMPLGALETSVIGAAPDERTVVLRFTFRR